jgi:hypothetical protein
VGDVGLVAMVARFVPAMSAEFGWEMALIDPS